VKVAEKLLGWSVSPGQSSQGLNAISEFALGEHKISPTAMTMMRNALGDASAKFLAGKVGGATRITMTRTGR
jgi:hypothetical protein